MKTHYYDMDLMVPMQANKEITFNEALLKMDSLCNPTVIDFIRSSSIPETVVGSKYVALDGDNKNGVYYCTDLSKGWQILTPKAGMILFVVRQNSFFIFNDEWIKLNISNTGVSAAAHAIPTSALTMPKNLIADSFFGIADTFSIKDDREYHYLYLNADCTIDLEDIKTSCITFLIKQNYSSAFKLTWSANILWRDKRAHFITATPNRMDIVRFYRLPETVHFIGEIVGQNYQF